MLPRCVSSDLALARRLEAAEAANAFVWARSAGDPVIAAPILGGCAVFAGEGSPLTHAMGIGMDGPVTAEDFDELEQFFRGHDSASLIDLCPLAHTTVSEEVFRRGYRVIELNNILVRHLSPGEIPPPAQAREVSTPEVDKWALTVAQGFAGSDDVPKSLTDLMEAAPKFSRCFLAESDGEPASGGGLGLRDGVAMFYGDSTRMAFRGRGLQTAVIQERLRVAAASECDIAMVAVVPGTASHRNYVRAGFQLAYMRVNIARDLD